MGYRPTNTTSCTNGSTPDLVATLWMSSVLKNGSTELRYHWNEYTNGAATSAFPSNMYSTSRMRVEYLNGGGDAGVNYATGATSRNGTVTQAVREANLLAPFSLSSATGIGKKSLTDYLVAPKDMLYQEKETFTWAFSSAGYHNLNEAWGTPDSGSYYSNLGQIAQKTEYLEWTNDKIWLPSMTETGFQTGTSSLWGIPTSVVAQSSILLSDNTIALRSGYQQGAGNIQHLGGNASGGNNPVNSTFSVRPALHLNLTAAEAKALHTLTAPSSVTTTYNGSNQDIAGLPQSQLPGWYDSAIYGNASNAAITYTDSAGLAVTPKDAGTYKMKIELKSPSYKWSNSPNTGNGENATTRIVDFVISKKKLGVTITDDDGDGIPDKVAGDSTALCTGDSMPNFGLIYGGTAGSGTASVPTAEGTYYATAQITDAVSNYEIDTTGTAHYKQFTIKGGVAEPYFASGTAGTITDTAKYTGSAIEFMLFGASSDITITPVNASGIAYNSTDKKLVVTGGVGTYTAKATLNDPSTKQWQSGGVADITLTVTITKGDYDFSKVKWQYQNVSGLWVEYPTSGLPYTGQAITIQVSGLPSGLSVLSTAYTDASKTDAGQYTAKVNALTGVNTTNYNAVTVSNVPELTQSWEITKKKLAMNWSTSTETTGSGDTIIIPSLPTDNAYTVVYYAESDWDQTANAPAAGATALQLSQLSVSSTSTTAYYAQAVMNGYPYAGNYEFDGQSYQRFEVGGGKTAVLVTLNNPTKVYDDIQYAPNVTLTLSDGTPASVNLSYKYYESDGVTELPGSPKNAGVYYVQAEVSPSSSAFAVSGTSKFQFEIEKADYDLTGLKWTDGTNSYGVNDVISFVYDGSVKTLQLAGLSDVTYAGSVAFGVVLGGDYAKKDAGTHTVTLNVTQDTDNYNACGLPASISWTITPLALDLSGITWNYDPSAPYVYECDENGAVEHTVAPVLPEGLPQEIVEVIEGALSGVYKQTDKGTYVATAGVSAALQNNNDIQNNYILTYPTSFAPTLNWKIEERLIAAPEYDGSWTLYDGLQTGHDMAALCGLPEDWSNYLDLSVQLTLPDGTVTAYAGYDGKMHVGNDAGEYELVFTVKNGLNPQGKDANVWLGEGETATVKFTVSPRTVTVTGWRGTGTRAQAQFAESDVLSDWYEYAVYDGNNQKVTADSSGKYPAGTYSRTVEPTSQNIEIKFAGAQFVAFTVDGSGNETGADIKTVASPTLKYSPTYNGQTVKITDENAGEFFDGWDAATMTVSACEEGKDAGEYTVTVTLKDPVLTAWTETENADALTLKWSIAKAKLEQNWTGEDPKLDLGEMSGLVEVEYVYYDADGKEVAKENLVSGSGYRVQAKLKDGYEKNFEFVDTTGTALANASLSDPYSFTFESKSWLEKVNNALGLPDEFPLWQLIVICICLILFIIFMIITGKKRKEKKEADEETQKYQEDMMLNS
ncbi:MAG: hypothetical protein K2H43_04495 [Clostridia bacterium]|nr:hypothetical protein [Clostridia bacterium]